MIKKNVYVLKNKCFGILLSTFCVSIFMFGCGFTSNKFSITNEKIKPFLKAASVFKREAFGFTSLPKSGDVYLEIRTTEKFDALMQITAETTRTIAFKLIDGEYKWVSEQETFRGPNEYKSVDGNYYESMILTCKYEKDSSDKKIEIFYVGEDPSLVKIKDLNLDVAKPILVKWGYNLIK